MKNINTKISYAEFRKLFINLSQLEKLNHPLFAHCRINHCFTSKGVMYRNITIYWMYDNSPTGVISVGEVTDEKSFDKWDKENGYKSLFKNER